MVFAMPRARLFKDYHKYILHLANVKENLWHLSSLKGKYMINLYQKRNTQDYRCYRFIASFYTTCPYCIAVFFMSWLFRFFNCPTCPNSFKIWTDTYTPWPFKIVNDHGFVCQDFLSSGPGLSAKMMYFNCYFETTTINLCVISIANIFWHFGGYFHFNIHCFFCFSLIDWICDRIGNWICVY